MKRDYEFYVYILASPSGTLYVGMTNDLLRRLSEHKEGDKKNFTGKHSVNKLVYYEYFQYVNDALEREKEIKKWRREKKEKLINSMNPHWNDLYPELIENWN